VTTLPERVTLIFDGSCDFCTRSVRWITALDHHRRISVAPFQDDTARAAAGLSVPQCEGAAWAVTPDGRRYPGAGAINVALAVALDLPLPLWLYGVPGIRQLQDAVYAWVVRNRHRLPGDTPFCAQHPERCGVAAGEAAPASCSRSQAS
jgi:predicted DCC family thiol-disulfide oxidoreductase YuxK